MFLFKFSNQANKEEFYANNIADKSSTPPPPPGRAINKGEAAKMAKTYLQRLDLLSSFSDQTTVNIDMKKEPGAIVYNIKWFGELEKQGATHVKAYFGLFDGRHTVIFVGADENGDELISTDMADTEYTVVEDGTPCCPKNSSAKNNCVKKLTLYKI